MHSSNWKDETGKRFGRLMVIGPGESQRMSKNKARSMFLCKCDCGQEVTKSGQSLRKGHTQSCGCLQKEIASTRISKLGHEARRYKTEEERILNFFYKKLRTEAKKRNLECTITMDEFKELYWQNCWYCASYPDKRKNTHRKIYAELNGLDRVDSTKGYHRENVVPCCNRCNKMKLNMTQQEFITHIYKIFNASICKISEQEILAMSETHGRD